MEGNFINGKKLEEALGLKVMHFIFNLSIDLFIVVISSLVKPRVPRNPGGKKKNIE